MSLWHTNIRSHPGHYLVDPYTWPWSPNGHSHGHGWPTPTLFVQCQSALPFWDTDILKFDHEKACSRTCLWSKVKVTHIWPWKFKDQGHDQSQTHWSQMRPRVQTICLLFISWQWEDFWLRYSKFHIWPWKFKVKVMHEDTSPTKSSHQQIPP